MRSQIFHGETTHCRHRPRRHAFRYRMFWLSIDLEELPELDRCVRGFGHNRRALVSVHDRDYGGPGAGPIREKIRSRLVEAGVSEPIDRITMMTIPKIAGYVFNPVSFYICSSSRGRIVALLSEVRNTFGEMHHYVAGPERPAPSAGTALVFRIPKQFYVSPFLDVAGDYEVRLMADDRRFDLGISLCDEGRLLFSAAMAGEGMPLTSASLLKTLGRAPLFAATIMLRIQWQALLLYVRKRVPMYAMPAPAHPWTTPAARRSFWQRVRSAVVRRACKEHSPPSAPSRFVSKRES